MRKTKGPAPAKYLPIPRILVFPTPVTSISLGSPRRNGVAAWRAAAEIRPESALKSFFSAIPSRKDGWGLAQRLGRHRWLDLNH